METLFNFVKENEGLFDSWELNEDIRMELTETEILFFPLSYHAKEWIGEGECLSFDRKGIETLMDHK